MTAPLQGLRVLDLSRILAGPWATQLLGDLGADVVKVERPGVGDDTRKWGPPFLRDAAGRETSESAYYLCANRNKRSLALDLSRTAGQDLLRQLACVSDVLVENFRAGTMGRYGLDYPALSALNPGLVYCAISAFGQTGPEAQAPGYDAMIQARGGMMGITGVPDDEPGAGPQKVGVAIADLATGLYATNAIQAALLARARTGKGQFIDLSLFDCQVALLANQASNYLVGGMVPERMGTAHPNIAPYQAFPTADGHIMIAVGNDAQFRRLVQALGLSALADDARFASNRDRTRNRASLVEALQQPLQAHGTAHWLAALAVAEVPCGPINKVDQVFSDPLTALRQLRVELPHALSGSVEGVGNPIRFSDTPTSYRHGPPVLGQHSEEVLRDWLGMTPQAIVALQREKAIEIAQF